MTDSKLEKEQVSAAQESSPAAPSSPEDRAVEAPSSTDAPPAKIYPVIGRKAVISLFAGLIMAVFVSALDETIVATAAVKITSDFNGFKLYSWVPVTYLITINAAQPIYGKISDIFGRRPVLLFALTVFLLGSAGCGWAFSMPFFLAARAVAGIGAGGLVGMAYIIIADMFPIEEGPKWRGILSFGFAGAVTLGPILGGVFTSEASWRWCFWINLPLVALTIALVAVFLRLPPRHIESYRAAFKRVDFLGAFFLVATISCLILPLSLGGSYWPWKSPQVIVLFIVSALTLLAFLYVQHAVAFEALIPIRLLTNGALIATWGVLFFYGTAFITFLYYLPVWYQIVEGKSSIIAGVQLLPILVAMTFNAFTYRYTLKFVERFPWAPFRTMYTLGGVIHLIGAVLIGATFQKHIHPAAEVIILLVYGLGCGLTIQTSFILAQIAVQRSDLAVANSLTVLFQNLGDAVGLAISGAINRGLLKSAFDKIPEDIVPSSLLSDILSNADLVKTSTALTDAGRQLVREKFAESLMLVFRITIAFAGLALIATFFAKPPPAKKPEVAKDEEAPVANDTTSSPASTTDEKEKE